jgi:hypothetical protein
MVMVNNRALLAMPCSLHDCGTAIYAYRRMGADPIGTPVQVYDSWYRVDSTKVIDIFGTCRNDPLPPCAISTLTVVVILRTLHTTLHVVDDGSASVGSPPSLSRITQVLEPFRNSALILDRHKDRVHTLLHTCSSYTAHSYYSSCYHQE